MNTAYNPFTEPPQQKTPWEYIVPFIITTMILVAILLSLGKASANPPATILKASWYSVESLKKEGTWRYSKGVMANGEKFNDKEFTCATRLFPLGTYLRISSLQNGKSCIVKVADRIGRRFATSRIDLSKSAFKQIADLKEGLVLVKIEVLNG